MRFFSQNTKIQANISPATSCFIDREADSFHGWLYVEKYGKICQLNICVGIFDGNDRLIFKVSSLPNTGYAPVDEINQVVMDFKTGQLYRLYIAENNCGIQSLDGTPIPDVAYVRTTLFYMAS